MSTTNPVPRIYRAVIDDVIKNVRESFLNEGIDEQVLLELKQLWESKLLQSRAIDFMPSDVNVRVSLTYPHNVPQMPGLEQTDALQQTSSQPTTQTQSTPSSQSGHLVQNQAGQIVYVSTHPTLGNVGPMSGPATQAAMALQNGADGRRILPQQVIQLQGDQAGQQQTSMYPAFQGRVAIATAPRVIFTPAQAQLAAAQQIQQQQQQQSQPPQAEQLQQRPELKQHIIQVDGSSDTRSMVEQSPLLKKTKHTNSNLHETKKLTTKSMKESEHLNVVIQLDGANDSSSEDLDGDEDDEDYDNYPIAAVGSTTTNGENSESPEEEEEPLNSEDDVSDDDPTDLFDTDNVVVCQYDKIARTRNRWKFHLKDGIMNLKSKDYVFHKANGDSEW